MRNTSAKVALAIIVLSGALAYSAGWDDAAIVDEDPHIGAGISYLTQRDMRINPEHPPLVKDLAALPLLLIPKLAVPTDHSSWTDDVNGQWDFGRAFLFQSGNDADLILRLSRIAPLLIMMLAGWFVFLWAKERAGATAGFIALAAFSFSPVVLAHGHYVTTDVPAAAGILIATYFFIRFLREPTRKHLLIAGIAFGLAQLTKFSVVLLIPYFGVLAIAWWLLAVFAGYSAGRKNDADRANGAAREMPGVGIGDNNQGEVLGGISRDAPGTPVGQTTPSFRSALESGVLFIGGTMLIGFIGLAVIYLVYVFHVIEYPQDRQIQDIAFVLSSFPNRAAADAIATMAGIDLLRPLAQYFYGLAMVYQRATGGNTTFFLGEVSASGWPLYFPIVYLVKLPIAFHLLTLLAIFIGFMATLRVAIGFLHHRAGTWITHAARWKQEHFPELAMMLFIALYWYTSLTSNLNIGVRHLLPVLPFVAILIGRGAKSFLIVEPPPATSVGAALHSILAIITGASLRAALIGLLVLWVVGAAFLGWPSYLASFNEIAGGPMGGVRWVVDSNLDWGQDLKRLSQFVETRGITHIAVDYFGWTPPEYYIKNAEVVPWSADKGRPSGWFAVSATYRQQSCAKPAAGFQQSTIGYCFLSSTTPEAVIGHSIFVYRLP